MLSLLPPLPSLLVLLAALAANGYHAQYITKDPPVLRAIAVLTSGTIKGTVQFIKENPYAQVQVHGNVTGLNPGRHGFHVHKFGDLTEGCKSAAAHYNPANTDHGAPADDIRHVGDLGNIEADVNGIALFSFYDRLLNLEGPQNILGRAVVVHEREDDLGRTTHPDSRSTGNAGGRLGCGVIGISRS